MKIEVGKYYIASNGRRVGPMLPYGATGYGYTALECGGLLFRESDGKNYPDHLGISDRPELDIISTAYPKQGTLKEIGAKPGDMVELVVEGDDDWYYTQVGTITKIAEDGSWNGVLGKYTHELTGIFRIVSRASSAPTSPVRTVTITRQEIVPGNYGRVRVTAGGYVYVNSLKSASELTAAIKTLTEIRDALA